MKIFFYTIISCSILINTNEIFGAQKSFKRFHNHKEAIQEIHIGDKLPDFLLTKLINSKEKSKSLLSLTGNKLLIIDFFATWCVPCVRALPALDKAQKMYHDKLNVLVVTNEPDATVKKFLLKNSNMEGIGLTIVTDDTQLQKMFPHIEVPHEVWVDRNGIVKAITSGELLTEENIADFLNGHLKELPVKKDMMDFDTSLPLFVNGNGGDGNVFLSRSILTTSMKGADSPMKIELDSNRNIKRILVVNHSALQILNMAYSQLQFTENSKRLILETRDSTKIRSIEQMTDQDEYYKYCYCYEYIPRHPGKAVIVFKNMLEDVNRYFSIYGSIEKREIPCWVLVRTKPDDTLLRSSGGMQLYTVDGKYRNYQLSVFVSILNRFKDIEPVIDGTNFSQPVDMDLNISHDVNRYPDIVVIRNNLKKYGLDLIKQDRFVDVLVIKDKQGFN
jgi:thiol-disulfide isomerase/thioredoxin